MTRDPCSPAPGWSGWIDHHPLGEAATVCVATGITAGEALDAYGADLGNPVPTPPGAATSPDWPGWYDGATVWVLPIEDAVLAVEPNGFQATRPAVLRRLAARGRVASCSWSVSMLPSVSFAEPGRAAVGFETALTPVPDVAPLRAAFDGIDVHDHRSWWGLEVLHRLTGHRVDHDLYQRLINTGVRHTLVPHLDDLTPRVTGPDGRPMPLGEPGPLGPDTDQLLDDLTGAQLREGAWWIAARLVEHYGAQDDPAISRTLATRGLDETATRLARTRRLSDGTDSGDHNLWGSLHAATNPDPRTAATDLLAIADYVLYCEHGPDRGGWPTRARAHIAPGAGPSI